MHSLVETRRALHAVAQQVLAPELRTRTGRIGLRATDGGFGQPENIVDGHRRRLRVDGLALLVTDDDHETAHPLGTLAEAASIAGIAVDPEVSAQQGVSANAPLPLAPDCVSYLAGFFTSTSAQLEALRRYHRDRAPTIVQLWPEHFDVACSMAEINFGASPGDDDHPEPYLYVGPWQIRGSSGWNESWGRSMQWTPSITDEEALNFFESGLQDATT